MYIDLINGEYGKFSGHTHPPTSSLVPGPADRSFLQNFNQKQSGIWGNDGEGWNVYGKEPWEDALLMNEINRKKVEEVI